MSGNNDDKYLETSPLLRLLPYADQLESYADVAGAGIRESFRRLLSSCTYTSHRLQFLNTIETYIELFGLRFTKQELADIITFGLSLAFCPQVDRPLREEWKSFVTRMLKYFATSCIEEIWQFHRPEIYQALLNGRYNDIFGYLEAFTPTKLEFFEEIKRVWLDEIIHIWYQYTDPQMYKAVVNFLAKFAHLFPGRVDMEPHLDYIFNFLVSLFLGNIKVGDILSASATIIANSIVPGSDVLQFLRRLFHFCKNVCHISSNNPSRPEFPRFCLEIVMAVKSRLHRELRCIPKKDESIGEIIEWARLTKEQVDELVEIVLPTCLDVNIYTNDNLFGELTALGAVRHLARLRPRLVIPQLVQTIEDGFSKPQMPHRVTQPLKVLAECITCIFIPGGEEFWFNYGEFRPIIQVQNLPTDYNVKFKIRTPEQRRQWAWHLESVLYPEGRALIPRILNICLKAFDLNYGERLRTCISILNLIFLAMPINEPPKQSDTKYDSQSEGGLIDEALKELSAKENVPPYSEMEELVMKIYERIFYLILNENENINLRTATDETNQISINTTAIPFSIVISAPLNPGLRARLVRVFLDIILQNHWTPAFSFPLARILNSLICNFYVDSNPTSEQSELDIALYALNDFWMNFKRSYNELKSDNAIIHNTKVEPKLIILLSMLPAFFNVFVPSRMKEVENDFINPVIEILFELLTISLGSGDENPPSAKLTHSASICLSGLLYRLVTFSVDFGGVDLYNSTGFATDPLWTPFVGYRKAREYVKWIRPTEETFALAKRILQRFLLPLLKKLSDVTDELDAFLVASDSNKSDFPQIPRASGQSKVAHQQEYLISLTNWIMQLSCAIFEGLKPRDICHEDVDYVKKICSELELLRHEAVACPESSLAARTIELDIPLFDLPSEDGSSLRDQIFRCGLRFLDVMAKLSAKFDYQKVATTTGQVDGLSVIGTLCQTDHLKEFCKIIAFAGFNYMEYMVKKKNWATLHYCPWEIFFNYFDPNIPLPIDFGPSREILSALSSGEMPSSICCNEVTYASAHLSIAWIMYAQNTHFRFLSRTLGRRAVWPETEATSLITYPRLPVCRELWVTLMKVCFRNDVPNVQLTEGQMRIRTDDQNVFSDKYLVLFILYAEIPSTLYFHASYDPDTHPENAPLRNLILSSQKLLKTLGGSEEQMMKRKPSLLVKTAQLRREAFRYFIHSIGETCLQNQSVLASFTLHTIYFNTPADHWDTPSIHAATFDEMPFRLTSPPHPPPSLSTIKYVVQLISSQNIHLAYTAANFVFKFLSHFLMRIQRRDFLWVHPRTLKFSNTCVGFENEPQYNCLAPENFNPQNLCLNLCNNSRCLSPPFILRDPCSHTFFPTISHTIESGFKVDPSNDEWLKVRSEMDLSDLSSEDLFNWREGLKTIAEFFASPTFWTQMSHVVLNYHQCKSRVATDSFNRLIYMVLVCFGPRPYLQRVEEFLMSLLQPGLTRDCADHISKYVGTSLVIETLSYVAQGSSYWPREMRLQVYGRVLPRLIVYAEAAAQLTSTNPLPESLPDGLKCVAFFEPDLVKRDIGICCVLNKALEFILHIRDTIFEFLGNISTCFESISNSSDEISNQPGDSIAKEIYCDSLQQDDTYIPDEADTIKCLSPFGSSARLLFPLLGLLSPRSMDRFHFTYSFYIWKFICELASVDDAKSTSGGGEASCGHRVPEGDGECPVCIGRRLFTRQDQRRALKFELFYFFVSMNNVENLLHQIKHFVDADSFGFWEKNLCVKSSWSRHLASKMSSVLSRAGFYDILNSAPSKIRLYTGVGHSVCSERQVSSALETELLSRLSGFEAAELHQSALCGPEFVMKRYLPMLVRDWMAVLLLRGFRPSLASFELQESLLSNAVKKLTPATVDLLTCSQRIKISVGKQMVLCAYTLMNELIKNVKSAYPTNALPNSSSKSVFDLFYRLAPLLADHVATSDYFWTKGKSKGRDDPLDKCIASVLSRLPQIATKGHTNIDVEIAQANRMMDFFDVFLRHSEWKTRFYGLILMKNLSVVVSVFWKRNEIGATLRTRLKRCLCELLADPWIDVAEMASTTISNSLNLSLLEYDELWIKELIEQSRHKLPKLKRGSQQITKQEKDTAMLCRRVGVFGLCSFVQAHPHDTPDYLPAVIAEVANHANDPQPIGNFVSKTLMEYSRSHADQWMIRDRDKFTEEQLEAYESVVSHLSYYV
ncbi:unnamed protein product [Hymenolepis diminuta]|uniref:BLM10_mid domain-containing protein n=1 Tax=Hymenolepis diminuta TaxID=6216 RepID=A0A0R3SDM8_HYMDI|nr:unnamed protein product [Hymenolepis diminuta]